MQKENEIRFSITTDLDKAKTNKRILAYANAYADAVKQQQKDKAQNN